VPLIYADRVRAAANKVKAAEEDLAEARADLREVLLEAVAEGIPMSVLAQHAGITRERVRQLVSPRKRRKS
jgi:hypothetical protein